jgi:hypothetical protein
MRRFDKIKNIKNVNLLAEQRHLESKGLIKEEDSPNNNHDRNAMINILARYGRNREALENLSYENLFLGLKDIATSKYLDDPLVKQLYDMLKPKKKGFFKEDVVDEEKIDEMAGRNLIDAESIDEDMVQEGSDTYFETLSEALDAVRQKVEQLGFEVDEDAMFTQFGTGGIPYETEKSANIPLLMNGEPILDKRGKEANRYIRVSIYRMPSGRYELTMYKTW